LPEEWKEKVIVPIMKKGKGKGVKDYRGDLNAHVVQYLYSSTGGKAEEGDRG